TSSHRWKASKRIPIFNVRSLRLSLSPPHYSCFLSLFFSLPPTFFLFFTHSLHCPQIHTHTHVSAHTHPHTHTHKLTYTHTHTHTHKHTYTHTHTHKHTRLHV